jgi:hypothetical protein
MKFKLYQEAALAEDLAGTRFRKGDLVRIVDEHRAEDGTCGYSVEIFNALGKTVGVLTLEERQLEKLRADESLAVREG